MVYRRDFRRQAKPARIMPKLSVTHTLILVNAVLFFLFLLVSTFLPTITEYAAIKPANILAGQYLWTIVTSVFMHGGFFHLFVNMFSLFFLGGLVERIIGRKRFFWFYVLAGILGSLFFVIFAYLGGYIPRGDFLFGSVDDYAVGASGAIFGLLGILAILLPRKKIYLIVGPLIVIVLQVLLSALIPSIASILNIVGSILIFVMIFSMFSPNNAFRRLAIPLSLSFWVAPIVAIVPLLVVGYFVKLPIGNMAHVGGLAAGLIYGAYLRGKYKQKVKLLNRMIG